MFKVFKKNSEDYATWYTSFFLNSIHLIEVSFWVKSDTAKTESTIILFGE